MQKSLKSLENTGWQNLQRLDTDHGAMMKSAFVREIALRMSSRMMDPQPGWFKLSQNMLFCSCRLLGVEQFWGWVRKRFFKGLRLLILAFFFGSTSLGFPLDQDLMSQQVELQAQIFRSMNTEPFQIANDGLKFLTVDTKVSRSSAELSLDAVLNASEKEEQRKSSGHFDTSLSNRKLRILKR